MPMRRRHPKNGDRSPRRRSDAFAVPCSASSRRATAHSPTEEGRYHHGAPRRWHLEASPLDTRRAGLLANARRRSPITPTRTRAVSSSRAALQLEQHDCSNSGEGKALLSRRRSELQLPPTHDLNQAQNVCVQHPKPVCRALTAPACVDRTVVELSRRRRVSTERWSSSHRAGVCRPNGGRALSAPACVDRTEVELSPRRRVSTERWSSSLGTRLARPKQVGPAAVDAVVGLVALLLSPRPRRVVQHPKQVYRALTAPRSS
jgi:hypothetical protein